MREIINENGEIIIEALPDNIEIIDSYIKTKPKIQGHYQNITVSVSGGADSDIVVDIISKLDKDHKVRYIFFDTGLEYEATKEHLKYLEEKYNITIEPIKAVKPIPVCCKEYGQPFISKYVSVMIERLQRYNFKWEDKSFDELYKEYPKCKSALMWWTNEWGKGTNLANEKSRFNIARNPYLKEFLLQNPPTSKISDRCCNYAKKNVAKRFQRKNKIDLAINGVRKIEGGVRASAYKSCFTARDDKWDEYRPIFWYTNDTKELYERFFHITHSACYTKYGLKRTGCAGCPFGRNFEDELKIMKEHEPQLYKAVNHIFKESYEYTRKYRTFQKEMKEKIN